MLLAHPTGAQRDHCVALGAAAWPLQGSLGQALAGALRQRGNGCAVQQRQEQGCCRGRGG
jgi:hypothetical protein